MSPDAIDRMEQAFGGVVRALGLLRPDTTPCGQPMSITEAHAIDELHRSGPLTQKAIANALRLEKSTVSRLVDQLEAADLVARSPNPADGRSFLVELTANGTARANRLRDARHDLFSRLIRQLGPEDRRTVVDGLTHLEEAARGLS